MKSIYRSMSNVQTIALISLLCLLFFTVGCRESKKPKITGFTPLSGQTGETVTITGTNFSTTAASNTVKFNGTAAIVSSATPTQIVTTVPAGATTGKITVTVGNKTATSSSDFTVIIVSLPTITGFTPASGLVGDSVTITGTNFSTTPANNTVKFNGTTAVATSSTSTQIVVPVPAGATTGTITVTVNGNTATSSGSFTVVLPPTITGFAPESGTTGDTVTITGTNFSATPANNTVKFNGTAAVVTISSATQITATVPNGASTGKITVEVGGNTATSSADFTVEPPITLPVFGGQYEDGDGNTMPCYWIGDERVPLAMGTDTYGWALSPTVTVGNTVYAVGKYYNNTSHKYFPCYWAGSTRHDLTVPAGATSFVITGIAVSNGDVYTVGYYDYQYDADHNVTIPCYWVNTDQPQLLTDPLQIGRAYANAITVSNGNVYVGGYYLLSDDNPATPPYQACYWEGTTLVNLPTPAIATSNMYVTAITVSGGTVYTAGTFYYADGVMTHKACYWTGDNDPVLLPSPEGNQSDHSYASSIAVSGGVVYVSGEYVVDGVDRVCYWKDGDLMNVTSPSGSIDQYSSAMVIINDTVYIGGGYNYMYDFTYYWRPCYWTDDALTNLDDVGQNAYINSSMWWWD
jgi:hypothetical protein